MSTEACADSRQLVLGPQGPAEGVDFRVATEHIEGVSLGLR